MFSELITSTSGNANQYSRRQGGVDRIILHHCATTSLNSVLQMMATGSREVSANYVIGNGGEIVGVVPEEFRAWTSGSSSWDGRAITFEIVNETAAPDWRISDKAMEAVSRMLADISERYGFELNRETVVTHQELYSRYDASYPTACPGPYLQPRIDQVIAAALVDEEETFLEDDMSKPMLAMKLDNGPMHTLGVMIDPDGAVTTLRPAQWGFWTAFAKVVPIECTVSGQWEYLMGTAAARRARAGVAITEADLDRITEAVREVAGGGERLTVAEVAEQLQITVKG